MMPPLPDIAAMPINQLRAWSSAIAAAIAALEAAGGGEVALFADAEGVSVTFTIPIDPQPEEAA